VTPPVAEDNPAFAIPVFGPMFKGLSDAVGALLNIGADLPPAVRARAKKVVVAAIIINQIAATSVSVALRRRIK